MVGISQFYSSQVIAVMVDKQERKRVLNGEMGKRRKFFNSFDFTRFTSSLNRKKKKKLKITCVSSRSEGVAISQKRDKKK
jgi:hypothetical protein